MKEKQIQKENQPNEPSSVRGRDLLGRLDPDVLAVDEGARFVDKLDQKFDEAVDDLKTGMAQSVTIRQNVFLLLTWHTNKESA